MHATPTGVDRCEMAYARGLLRTIPDRLHFAAVHPAGGYGRLDRGRTLRFRAEPERGWDAMGHAPGETGWRLRAHAARTLLALRP
ncbi:MAG: glycosyltransferase family 1 protein, partial [Sphingomonas sp.]